MNTTDNPVLDVEEVAGRTAHEDKIEAAAATLRKQWQNCSEPQTVEAMEKLMLAHTAALRAELEHKFYKDHVPGVETIRAVVAHLSEAPANWHQSAVHFAALPPDDEDSSWSCIALLGSMLMVGAQCMVAMGVMGDTISPACGSTDHCEQKGTFCYVFTLIVPVQLAGAIGVVRNLRCLRRPIQQLVGL